MQGCLLSPLSFGHLIDRVQIFMREMLTEAGVHMGQLLQIVWYVDDLVAESLSSR